MMGTVGAPSSSGSPNQHWYKVEVKVEGFIRVHSDGRKSYMKGFKRDWVVDSGSFSMDFISWRLSAEVEWGENQRPVVCVFDKESGEDVRVVDDAHLLKLVEMYKPEKHTTLWVGIYSKDLTDEPLCVLPPDPVLVVPPQPMSEPAENPEPKGQASSESKAKDNANDADEEDELPDFFDFWEEYVGVNDEHMYVSPTEQSGAQQAPNSQTANFWEELPANPKELEANADKVHDVDPEEVVVLHDPENPDIRVGAQYPDIIAFRKAIRHYATIKGCEFAGIKTDKTRYRKRSTGEDVTQTPRKKGEKKKGEKKKKKTPKKGEKKKKRTPKKKKVQAATSTNKRVIRKLSEILNL